MRENFYSYCSPKVEIQKININEIEGYLMLHFHVNRNNPLLTPLAKELLDYDFSTIQQLINYFNN